MKKIRFKRFKKNRCKDCEHFVETNKGMYCLEWGRRWCNCDLLYDKVKLICFRKKKKVK